MTRKTERIYASADLDGENHMTAAGSFSVALHNLAIEAKRQGREALFDTLEVEIERKTLDVRTLMGANPEAGATTITVSAEAVKVSETTNRKDR